VSNTFVVCRFLKSIWLARQNTANLSREPASTITTCRDSAILSETGFSSRKSRQPVADTSELVRDLSASTC